MKFEDQKNVTMYMIGKTLRSTNDKRGDENQIYKERGSEAREVQGEAMKSLEVSFGRKIAKCSSQVEPFYITLLINNKLERNCILDLGVAINIMPLGIMRQPRLWVGTAYGKCYAMHNKEILVLGFIKYLELKFAAFPNGAYKMDVIVANIPPQNGMLLSRQQGVAVGGCV